MLSSFWVVAIDGVAIDGVAVDGVAVDVVAVDVVAVDGVVVADSDVLVIETEAVDNAEDEKNFVENTSDSYAAHQLPALSPLLSMQVELFPFLLKKITSPVRFTCIQAAGEPSSVPHTSTLRAEYCSLSSIKLLATTLYLLQAIDKYLNNHLHLVSQMVQSNLCNHSCHWTISNTGDRNL